MGRLVVVSAPSAAGKTTVIGAARARRPELDLALSATTRRPRPGEQDGEDYRFVSDDEFSRLEAGGAFLETAVVHGNRYGTLRAPVEDALRAGRTVLLEIDIQGARSIRAAYPDALLVFIEPPSFESLVERLRSRGTEDEAAAAERTANARIELAAAGEFDHRIVNDELDRAVVQLLGIIDRYQADPGPATPKETP